MKENLQREIPYNYTSAEDEQVVRLMFGSGVWDRIERLRVRRVTGRSARLLMRFIGDMFILRRNPFLYQEMVDSERSRRYYLNAYQSDLDVLHKSGGGDPDVLLMLEQCQDYLNRLKKELTVLKERRKRILRVLGAVVGEENVFFDPFSMVGHVTDATDWRLFLPVAVIFPSEEGQVAPLLLAIEKLGLKAIPRGAGTGLTGGAVPVAENCVMINLEKLNRIRGIREEIFPLQGGDSRAAKIIEVEAGVVTQDAMQASTRIGWVFATDPTSAWASTIGGNLAENAGGKTAVLWGTAIDNVLSFSMALPGGRTIQVKRELHPLRKILHSDRVCFSVHDGETARLLRTIELTGGDIRKKGLWKDITNKALKGLPGLQKEGTDGVITSAEFVLHPTYEHLRTACLEFFGGNMDEAGRVILDLSCEFENRGSETLMALEHFDEEYVQAIGYKVKAARGGRPKAVLLIDLVAREEVDMIRGLARLQALVDRYSDTELFLARDNQEGGMFWADRKRLGAISKHTNAFKLNEDVVLPLDALAGFTRYIDACNVAEARHSQTQFVENILEWLDAFGDCDDSERLSAKDPAARDLCATALTAIQSVSSKEAREGGATLKLKQSLMELFRGYAEVEEAIEKIHQKNRSRLIVIATHMHAGDGNVHVNIPVFSNDREMLRRAFDTADAIMRHVVEVGGVVSGEHGIGITKLKHLGKDRLVELAAYRAVADPTDLMNPGKLSDLSVPDLVYTPSFNLLELEAKILQNNSLYELAEKISKCVRCGKCKPDCCVFHPARNMFYHPRNKNLAIGAIIEALLYDAQRARSTRFEFLKELEEIADHCTICHKCLKPCPVDIDTGEISILERRILSSKRFKHTTLATRLSLGYLKSRSRVYNVLFRQVVLVMGLSFQRKGAKVLSWIPDPKRWKALWPFCLLRSPMPVPDDGTLHSILPKLEQHQALLISPAEGDSFKTVFYFPGCGSERLYSDVGKASVFLLLKAGVRVVLPPAFLCCGFPINVNAQMAENNRRVLSDTIIFSQIRAMLRHLSFDACVVSCGTCKEALHAMGMEEIFQASLEDVSRFALSNGLRPEPGEDCLYHKPCHDSLSGTAEVLFRKSAGIGLTPVPHCCSEAGTLALSRPDIAFNMLDKKTRAVKELPISRKGDCVMLTNCPSCLQGLGRNVNLGVKPRHMAVELARRSGGDDWKNELKEMLQGAETVNF